MLFHCTPVPGVCVQASGWGWQRCHRHSKSRVPCQGICVHKRVGACEQNESDSCQWLDITTKTCLHIYNGHSPPPACRPCSPPAAAPVSFFVFAAASAVASAAASPVPSASARAHAPWSQQQTSCPSNSRVRIVACKPKSSHAAANLWQVPDANLCNFAHFKEACVHACTRDQTFSCIEAKSVKKHIGAQVPS